ncbi:MAG: hypothetical protein AAGI88_10315 [Pseudomonadota bacterium]
MAGSASVKATLICSKSRSSQAGFLPGISYVIDRQDLIPINTLQQQ